MDQFDKALKYQLSLRGVQYDPEAVHAGMEKVFYHRHGKPVSEATIEFAMSATKMDVRAFPYYGANTTSAILAGIAKNNEPVNKKRWYIISGINADKLPYVDIYEVEDLFKLAEIASRKREEDDTLGEEFPLHICAWSDLADRIYH